MFGRVELAHVAEAATDHATHGLASCGVGGERRVFHALAHFKTAHGLFRVGRFVNIGRHGEKGLPQK
jgi:hypothetical protein